MKPRDLIKFVLFELIYLIICLAYMVQLKALNDKLLYLGLDNNAFELLMYDNYKAVYYFVGALILYAIGVLRLISKYTLIKSTYLNLEEIIISIFAMAIILILLITIFILIQNPVLRAIIVVGVLGIMFIKSI